MARESKSPLPGLGRLRAFDAIVATGGMSEAARLLRMTQPAITRAAQALDRDIGTPLLSRSWQGSFPTPAGVVFSRRTRRFFQQIGLAVEEVVGEGADGARLARKLSGVHVRSLLALWKSGGYRQAARNLGVAEPSLHRPARELERLLGASLFRRAPTGVRLSPVGSELARRFALAVGEITAGLEELAELQGAMTSIMRVGALALAPKRPLAEAAEALLRDRPRSRIEIVEGSYADLVIALRSGAIDAVFGALQSPPPFADLREEPLFADPYAIVCRRDHPLTRIQQLAPHGLAPFEWVFPTRGLPRRAFLDDLLATWGLAPRVQIETSSFDALISLLCASDRVSLFSRKHILMEGRPDLLEALDVIIPQPTRLVGLTTRLDWLPTSFQSDYLTSARAAYRRHDQ